MRVRIGMLVAALCALGGTVPAIVTAAPHHNRGLTINATPNPILADEGVLIYGQLNSPPIADQTVLLYHHLAGARGGWKRVGSTTTDTNGFYSFMRADGVVETNRAWFVREAGAAGVHSRTVYEKVAALVSLCASTTSPTMAVCQQSVTGDTGHAIVFSGHVTPNHAGERVLLQQQTPNGDDWRTIASGIVGAGSNYRIAHRWRVPNSYDVRVVFPRQDVRNERGESDAVSVTVQQTQVPGFTITSSSPIIPEGSQATISGVLDMPGTSAPEGSTVVQLYGRTADQSHFRPIGVPVQTASDGSYTFTVTPVANTVYLVRTVLPPHRSTAKLFEGVKDVLTLTPSSSTSTVGGTVTFKGSISPTTKVGRWIYLQLQGSDGDWHSVQAVRIAPDSTFQFAYTFGQTGTFAFRARKYGDEHNVGAASTPVSITVTGTSAPSSLPPGS